jgi:O-acetyl-ADP-ribose deacetylase (regulator of RNase III)
MSDDRHLKIAVTPVGAPAPFPVEAVVYEDDTQLVLGSDRLVREVNVPPSELVEQVARCKPHRPGTVVVREGPPLRFHAVVHDLVLEPSWREEWISSALARVFDEANALGVSSIALPVLGTLHGQLDPARFCELLAFELERDFVRSLEKIWLVVVGDAEAVQGQLRHLGWG